MTDDVKPPASGRAPRPLTALERKAFRELRAKLAPGGLYAVKAQKRVEDREARSAAIIKIIDGKD